MLPYDDNVPLEGEGKPPLENVTDWIRMLLTVHKRWGNTATVGKTHIAWGGVALWAQSKSNERIAALEAEVGRLREENEQLRNRVAELRCELKRSKTHAIDACDACRRKAAFLAFYHGTGTEKEGGGR